MKRFCLSVFVVLLSLSSIRAGEIQALLKYCTFSTPDNNPYVETYISINGSTVVFKKNTHGKMQASVEIGLAFSQGSEIKGFKKYVLNSPEISDSALSPFFIDQQRFHLPNGDYLLELSVLDKNKPGAKAVTWKEPIHLNHSPEAINLSGIELIESYKADSVPGPLNKNGYSLTPYIANTYPQNMDKLRFYTEVYHADKSMPADEKYIILYYVETFDNALKMEEFGGHQKVLARPASVVLSEIAIGKLPSGSYNLVVEVHDKNNQILSFQKIYFQRINPVKIDPAIASADIANTFVSRFHSTDSLADYIRSTKALSNDMEYNLAENDIKTKDLKVLQRRLLIFWSVRYPSNPEAAFERYNEQVIAVNRTYGTQLIKGYNTDRGRVYLQYGQPSARSVADKEPSAYPYEIWTYYKLPDGQANKKFVFYNPDLVSNNYQLIHSDARGEIYDVNWNMKIHSRNVQTGNFDDTTAPDHFGGNAAEDFDHPK